ncbi:hypothetical protein L226DRAFT_504132 [Lentinus tigrinus ALCF2SS1-7]|uniref:Telomere-associated protein Rif1 N-terminal domain-containing protein n=1 Tax=Lentinus tigrinus ALCF2SS1-6 TaxID=1328759 RepID=A0A5C2SGX2_9APHY|nr:hypothetical protein L227DRAFT_573698 [Lentinus tigrinus ALCF2SS1-6]RPD77718.1 hypothetical protein L226DRAFT_504132 [Lentinus tigrinus ALCF2SS1-7]
MSLPTPPGTSHRDEKENRAPRFTRVSWCEQPEYHPITASPPRTLSTKSSATKAGPSRSILKRTAHIVLPPFDEDVKESTPEPEDPLTDLHYVDHPVAQIIALDASLRDHIQAYSILAARLRTSLAGNADADASWPLFQPLRKQRKAFVQAVVRDLCSVFIDPLEGSTSVTDSPTSPREPPSTTSLPSPRESPKKKKQGMSAEQVKRARDLCGVCHAAMRLLNVVFTSPSLWSLFDEEELGYVWTQVLAIPLANQLPTPNARKTCALAIWLIQTQRLPAEVLEPARDRIAYALRRGIEGELGKEGKKGSQTDGLKAIHDLSLYLPAVFVPAFAPLVGPIISCLLAPTLVIRNQACHALGGLALAASSLPPSEAHTRISTAVASRLMRASDVSPTTPSKKRVDASPSKDSLLVRTLRTTLQAPEPRHAAQGPVWGFSVVAHLVVLLGPTVWLHSELTRTIVALFTLGMRHPKSSARALGCLAWRAMVWAFFRPPHIKVAVDTETDGEDDSATEDDIVAERRRHDDTLRVNLKLLGTVLDMGAGVCTVGALLGPDIIDDTQNIVALRVLRFMCRKGGQMCKEAMDLTRHLLSGVSSSAMMEDREWDHRRLLPQDFFSANPGLLTAEWKMLPSVVRAVIEECPQITDIRRFSSEEASAPGMWEAFLEVWKEGLSVLKLQWGREAVPSEIREIWFHLLTCNVRTMLDNEDDEGLAKLAVATRDVLLGILEDPDLDFILREAFDDVPTSPVKPTGSKGKGMDEPLPQNRWNYAIKLFLVHDLFMLTRAVIPSELFSELAESVLRYLNVREDRLVGEPQCTDQVREQWASLCAEVTSACDTSVLQAFWENTLRKGRRESDWDPEVRSAVWQVFVERWESNDTSNAPSWETAVVLLSAPFIGSSDWDMESEAIDMWDKLLRQAIDTALDHGIDATTLVDQIAGVIATNHSPSSTAAVRIADLLLSNVEIAEARQVPSEVFEFANDTLNAAYPPAPRHSVMCMWLIRTLTRVIDGCPPELCFTMLELIVEGLRTWVADEFHVCTADEYSCDILPLYQTVLISMQALPVDTHILETLAPFLVAPFSGRVDKHAGTVDAFDEFWQATYAGVPVPPCGYPEQIAQCLAAVAKARLEEQEDEAFVEDMTAIQDGEVESPVLEQFPQSEEVTAALEGDEAVEGEEVVDSEDEGSIVVPSPGTLAAMSGPIPIPRASPLVPLTPKASPRRRHPHATPSHSENNAHCADVASAPSPASSAMDCSPTRSPTTPKRSPAKQPAKNKENHSPLPRIPTVAERLAMQSPLLLESILGKRSRVEDAEEPAVLDERAHKINRLDASPLGRLTVNRMQVRAVMHDSSNVKVLKELPVDDVAKHAEPAEDDASSVASDDESLTQATPTPLSRKRKGVFMDVVEVPAVETIMRRRRLSMSPAPEESYASTSSAPQPLRRTRSATKLLGEQANFQKLGTPKRRRLGRAEELREEAADLSSPLRFLRDAPLFGSDDSIMVASPDLKHVQDLPPSDDDLPIGQVTPRRLVSPALRRVQHTIFSSDPPSSDDSNESISPTTQRVSRKIARLPSSERSSRRFSMLGGLRSRSLGTSSSSSALGNDL